MRIDRLPISYLKRQRELFFFAEKFGIRRDLAEIPIDWTQVNNLRICNYCRLLCNEVSL